MEACKFLSMIRNILTIVPVPAEDKQPYKDDACTTMLHHRCGVFLGVMSSLVCFKHNFGDPKVQFVSSVHKIFFVSNDFCLANLPQGYMLSYAAAPLLLM